MRSIWILSLAMLLPIGVGCSSGGEFSQKVSNVSAAGTSKTTVQRTLGKPDEKKIAVSTGDNAPPTVATGSRYERWTYNREGKRHDVYLGPSLDQRGTWEVHAVKTSHEQTAAAW
jgi:hypothetical protein